MSRAVLVAGDLDFAPLVECLIRVGTHVTVMYERTSAAADLYRAADVGTEIDIGTVYGWSSQAFQQSQSLPKVQIGGGLLHPHFRVQRNGLVGGKAAVLYKTQVQPEDYVLRVEGFEQGAPLLVQSADLNAIERYMKLTYSPVSWTGGVAKLVANRHQRKTRPRLRTTGSRVFTEGGIGRGERI